MGIATNVWLHNIPPPTKKNVSKGVELYVNRKPQVTFMLVLNEFLHDINLDMTNNRDKLRMFGGV
jgi:hypothetical protein